MDFKMECRCTFCNEKILPGEIHYACLESRTIDSKEQCIICLSHEGEGNHETCQLKILVLRDEFINLFKG